MMVPKDSPLPAQGELEILAVLWQKGPSAVGEVHEIIAEEHPTKYTTTLKLLQIMLKKGLVLRDTSRSAHVYAPSALEAEMQKRLIEDLIARAFSGDAGCLVRQTLELKKVPHAKIKKIMKLIETLSEE